MDSTTGVATSSGDSDTTGSPPLGNIVEAEVRDFVAWDVTQGWSSTRYLPSLGKFVAIFVNHYSPDGYQNNSLRAFDPVAETVEYLHPKDVAGAPIDRNNHEMFFVAVRDEIWVSMPWSVLDISEAVANADLPESYGAVAWTPLLDSPEFAATVGISGLPDDWRRYNAAVAWDAELDVGVMWGGSLYAGADYTSDLFTFRPNGAGYDYVHVGSLESVVTSFDGVGTANGRHNGAILGGYFQAITLDEHVDVQPSPNGFTATVRLWRYPLMGPDDVELFEQMAPLVYEVPDDGGRYGMYFPCVTADTGNNLLLVYLASVPGTNLYAYLVDLDEWVAVESDVTPGYRALAGCDYSADHGLHAYWDGLNDRPPEQQGWGTITLTRTDG